MFKNAGLKKASRAAEDSEEESIEDEDVEMDDQGLDEDQASEDDPFASDDDDDEDDDVQEFTSRPTTTSKKSRPSTSSTRGAEADDDLPPPIPPKLLTRLLYEGLEDKDMKIGREAMAVLGKYFETFVREALARAALERQGGTGTGDVGDGFLQVEDLEKLAPQLLLDF
jgi:CENP-S associating Centromere protein X